ncbi:MAG: nucleotidyltransferase domain-containing protein [Lachnospiraceae bacterium]|nr:nucleotidyltransferase domain-containing protein [Lachnospiraceae bacterium]
MKYNIPDIVLKDICLFAKERGVKKVILFGSRARGTHTVRSDIDIAVCGGDTLGLYLDLVERSHTLLMFDVINLDKGIDDELKHEIERDGILIYEET